MNTMNQSGGTKKSLTKPLGGLQDDEDSSDRLCLIR